MRRILLATACVAAFTTTAWAGDGAKLVIETKHHETARGVPGMPAVPGAAAEQNAGPRTSRQTVLVEGQNLRMDVPAKDDPTGKDSTALFDGKVLTVLEHGPREYDEISKARMERIAADLERRRKSMGGGMGGAGGMGGSPADIEASKKRLKDALAKLPPQTPPNIRKMMESQLEALEELSRPKDEDGKRPPITVKNLGSVNFEGGAYTKWAVHDGELLKKHIYTVPVTGVLAKAYPGWKGYAVFLAELQEMMPEGMPIHRSSLGAEIRTITGFPKITIEYDRNGKVTEEWRVTSVEAAPIPDGSFVRPANYRKRPDPLEGGGAGPPGGFGR